VSETKPRKRIEVFRAGLFKKAWAFRFRAANGEIVASSENYHNKLDAIAAANLVKAGYMKTPVTVEDAVEGLAPDPEAL